MADGPNEALLQAIFYREAVQILINAGATNLNSALLKVFGEEEENEDILGEPKVQEIQDFDENSDIESLENSDIDSFGESSSEDYDPINF